MGYPGDEGGGPPDSRLGVPAGRRSGQPESTGPASDQREPTRRGSHRRPDGGSSHPGPAPADEAGQEYATPAPGAAGYAPAAPGPGPGRGTGPWGRDTAGDSEPRRGATRAAQAPPAVSGGPPSRENAWRRPDRRPGQEIQGAPENGAPSGGPPPRGSLWSAGAFRTAGPGGRGPVRGFPPASGAPDPVYPPGQFSPWNATALRAVGAAGRPGLTAGSGPETSEPEYSLLAVSDPSADATATQTWAALDDAHLDQLDEWGPASAGTMARPGQDENGHPLAGEGYQTGPRGFFESASGAASPGLVASPVAPAPPGSPALPGSPAAPGATAPSGYPGRTGTGYPGGAGFPGDMGFPGQEGYPGQPGFPGETGFPGEPGYPGETGDADSPGHPGDAGYPGQTDPSLRTARPGGRMAARQSRQQAGQETQEADTGGFGTGGSRSAARGRKPRKPPSRARMWLMPLVMMAVVIVGITVAYLHFAKRQTTAPAAAPTARQDTASGSASPSLGPWKHITTRADDPTALTLTELFPAHYSASGTVARTTQRAGHNCPNTVLGNRLRAAVKKAGCTQVMRASYLSAGQKIMATIGVLNLGNVTDAERAGKATGATAFIKQLPAAHGPTKNLMKGTGLEEAQIKGHYLILTWAEFTNLKTPGSTARRQELDTFSRQLVASTAGISLTSRMVFGKPEIP